MCEYCECGVPLVTGKTDDIGVAIILIHKRSFLNAYGYDIHGPGSNGILCRINFCPMCGRKLMEAD